VGSCVAGFLVNIAGSLLTKRTSAMTLKTMTMARNAALVLFSALVMGETITSLEATGYTLLLGFFVVYTVAKAHEPKEPPPPPRVGAAREEGDEEDTDEEVAAAAEATPMLPIRGGDRS